MGIPVTVTYLGEFMDGPRYQGAVTQVHAIREDRASARADFVRDWNTWTGQSLTEADFDFTDVQ